MTQQDQLAVLRLVLSAGGLPLCRDAPSYLAVVSVLHGGLGGQNAYMRAVLGELGSEDEEDDEEDMEDYEVAGLREQVKSDAQSRYETLSPSGKSAREEEEQASVMSDARREAVRGSPRSEEDAEVVGRRTGGDPHPAEAKDGGTMARSSPAATVAARDVKGEAKARAESKSQRRSYSRPDKDDGDRFRLLGDLPSLQEQGRGPGDLLSVGLDLSTAQVSLAERLNVAAEELARALPPGLAAKSGASRSSPSAASQGKPSSSRTKGKARGRRSQPSTEARAKADAILKQENSEVPGSFACAVNGHVMKEPMVSPYGHSFERSTIELWLRTQGSVCPVTHQPLTADMLKPDTKLRDQIVRWQIQRSTSSQVQALTDEEDLYEF
uniref:U-box domain-containing protein n=1 Tax=Rhizochromulina marina TaxID=1034831 RepID=A0A7S2RXM5_9STRA|mmetsp:Transcript_22474/g.65335  ORF Transcript_22474/g.65335 Transcript_22474/m.65335 type:complete len:382 (+) Transcript_22474:3-1148(+)